jgi:hypothetical protein
MAALNAARYNKKTVSMADFEWAKDKVLEGSERKSAVMSGGGEADHGLPRIRTYDRRTQSAERRPNP